MKANKEHDPKNLSNLRSSLNTFLDEEADEDFLTKVTKLFKNMMRKGMPNSSDVHVPTPIGSSPEKKPKRRIDSNIGMQPTIDNLEAGILKAALGEQGENEVSGFDDMQSIVEGTDWELANGLVDESDAQHAALEQLEINPNHYKELMMEQNSTDDVLAKKDTRDNQNPPPDDPDEGLCIDIGCGQAREPGFIGLDLYPYDHGTMIHDAHMGLPFDDGSVKKARLVNSLHEMDELSQDPKPLLSEIHRVMMPGGQFVYEGPNDIYNYPQWQTDYPGFCLVGQDDNQEVHKDASGKPVFRQTFTRLATPDPATANDAEPRIGIPQTDMLPADALLAIDAVNYDWSDATSSGAGNRNHGYPSQGAMVTGQEDEKKKKALKSMQQDRMAKIAKADKVKQIAYCIVLAPDEIDAQNDIMSADDIENAAHYYMANQGVIGSQHSKAIDAKPVESYIAPQDFTMDEGPYGPQTIKKGSWVLGIKVNDPSEWEKVENGEYTGVSVGGMGARIPV